MTGVALNSILPFQLSSVAESVFALCWRLQFLQLSWLISAFHQLPSTESAESYRKIYILIKN
ncbi:hypothetical protein GEOBRER4_n1009 [Citrifermentans bremense]|uniref:Uncharacterized protein n=1 Tax=Citrifermentans bremense TaxID=60035 RepID=A0A7R7FRZ6_9BACT|nr:hypothetical protein GEOBRER4_n1009 [Citrifermentans bremense]